MKVYNIAVSEKNVKSDVVGNYLNNVFSYTWKIVKGKNGEVWYCARKTPVIIDDLINSIKCLHKDITGVLVSDIIISSIGCDRNGCYFEDPGKDPTKHPGTEKMMEVLMNDKN